MKSKPCPERSRRVKHISHYVAEVMAQVDHKGRNAALNKVPANLRGNVEKWVAMTRPKSEKISEAWAERNR